MAESNTTDSDTVQSADSIPISGEEQKTPLSNSAILSLFEDYSSGKSSFHECYENLKHADLQSSNESALRSRVDRLITKQKTLKRNKKRVQLDELLRNDFIMPKDKFQLSTENDSQANLVTMVSNTKFIANENRILKRQIQVSESENEMLGIQIEHCENRIHMLLQLLDLTNSKYDTLLKSKPSKQKLIRERDSWEKKYEQLLSQLEHASKDLEEKNEKLRKSNARNLNKKLKRRDSKIESQVKEIREKELKIKESSNEIESLKVENECKDREIDQVKREKRNLLVKVSRLSKKKNNQVSINHDEIERLKEEIKEKHNRIKELEQINSLIEDSCLQTFYEGKYTNEIRQTIMTLITECGVSQSKVNQVIKTVVENVTGKSLERLPSTGVKSRLVTEAKRIAQKQVAEAMIQSCNPDEPMEGNCLHQDGTSKFHKHFQSFQITTYDNTTYSLGLAEIASGNSETIVNELKSQISDLAGALKDSNSSSVAKLVTSITSTMSDQGSTNPVFNKQLQDFKESLMPEVYSNWDELNDDVKVEMCKISSFFCKMHIFVNMAQEVDRCLLAFEQSVTVGKNPFSFDWKESSSSRLTRTASKALTMRGCDKSGVGGHFDTFLKDKNKENKLVSFRGHRFNHLFYAAGAIYHHVLDIQQFLQQWSDPNELLKSVHFDIKEKTCLCGIRALGIIDKLITGPFWRKIEQADNILDLNPVLEHLRDKLDAYSQDASPLLKGECIFTESDIHKDEIFESLFEESNSDDPSVETYTQMALELATGGMLLILERQAKDQLTGGKFSNPSDIEVIRGKNVPTTNTCSERDFAQLDVLMRTKPSASTVAFESMIMWTNNKTSNWLNSLGETERQEIINDARKNAPLLQNAFREKQKLLFNKKLEVLKLRQQKKEMQEEKAYTQKVKLTHKLNAVGGLWTSEKDLNDQKEKLPNAFFKEAVISQLQFRKQVLGSKGQKEKFQQVSKGHTFTLTELEENLKSIMDLNRSADEADSEVDDQSLKYKNMEDARNNIETSKLNLIRKIREGRDKIIIQQQTELLQSFISNPELLVGKNIKHKCREENSTEICWYRASVRALHKNKGKQSEFIVVYEESEDDEWRFPLLIDMSKGDLIIIQ